MNDARRAPDGDPPAAARPSPWPKDKGSQRASVALMAMPRAAVAAAGLVALALLIALALMLWPLRPGVLALQFAATPRAFGAVVHAWGPEGLALYRAHLPWDFALLGAYAVFGWLLARHTALFRPLGARWQTLAAAALPLAALFDATENLLHGWLTAAPRFGLGWLYALSASVAAAKWLCLLGFAGLVCAALLRRDPR